jgi:hypothetical protein
LPALGAQVNLAATHALEARREVGQSSEPA